MSSQQISSASVKMWVVAISMAFALTACGGDDGMSDVSPADESTPSTVMPDESAPDTTPMDEEPEADSAEPADLPATGESSGRRVTVESFGSTTLAFGEVEDGMEVVYIEVTVENVSGDPFASSMFQFFLTDPSGELHGPELLGSDAGDNLPHVDPLSQGETSRGFVAFQVPIGSSLVLEYAVDLSVGETINIPVR